MAKESINTRCTVHFEPAAIDIEVELGGNLLDAAQQAGIKLVAACGGAGSCGTCKVQILNGKVESARTNKITEREYNQGVRQACQTKILSDLRVNIPLESRLETVILKREREKIDSARQSTLVSADWRYHPPLEKYYLELPPPTLEDNSSDLSRLLKGLRQRLDISELTINFDIAGIPEVLRAQDWKITTTILTTFGLPETAFTQRPALLRIESGDTRSRIYALAVDIGTTTVKAQLLDLNRGAVLSENAQYNDQIVYGADVITRIAYCQKPGGLKTLQSAVAGTINALIDSLIQEAGVERGDIGHISLAGNTTMIQILVGIDPKYIRLSPYTPAATYLPLIKASTLGLNVPEDVNMSAFPMVASYIGGDITAGVVAAGIHQTEKVTLYMDLGTNGQIVVGNSEWMATAACSAGPAFEGGEIKHGMVAIEGAIERCDISPKTLEPAIGTIGNKKPRGICGSGLINIVAELLETGIIERNGHFHTGLASNRIRHGIDGFEYVLTWASETEIEKDIVITEIDIANLVRAKAAMYAGMTTLIKSVGLTVRDIEQIIIAGSFGSYLNIERAIMIGLLPDLPFDRFAFIGNGSLLGARLAAFSNDILDQVRHVAKSMTNIELSENSDFMNNYIAALFLPHTHIEEFPSVDKRLARLNHKTME